jgi:proteasome regulatory subunit
MSASDSEKAFQQKLIERITFLERQTSFLADRCRRYDVEKRLIDAENSRLQAEVRKLRAELERLKVPPLIIGTVKDILPDGRVVVKSSTGPDFIVASADNVPKHELVAGARVALSKQTLAVLNVLPSAYDPIVVSAEIIDKPSVSYADIGGLDEQIREIKEAVELPLLKPMLYKKVGIEPPKGVLLIGPPGTGKTLLAKAVAHHTNAVFIRCVGSELVQKYIGEGARLVRELFELARKKSPSIIFIDELDAIGSRRIDLGTSGDREVQRTLMQLLAELDGFDPIGNVRLIGATNRADMLDEALVRPGRFDRIIEIPIPNYQARVEIFKIHTRKMSVSSDLNIEFLCSKCEGATGADIKAICTEAGMFAIRENREIVNQLDFENAIEKVLASISTRQLEPTAMFA